MTTTANPLLENCCSPCNKCPDDGDILEVEILPADECWGWCWNGCCWKKCNDNCWINIQSTNDCLEVDTSECGVVKITSHCPPIVTAWDNIKVDVEDCWQPNCSLNYIVSAQCEDEKVKVCNWDSTSWYLKDKIQAWTWIKISSIGCDWSDSKLKISIDENILPDCPEPPDLIIHNQSSVINVSQTWWYDHVVTITDKDSKPYYAKLVLADNHIWTIPAWIVWDWEEYLWQRTAVSWKPVRSSWQSFDVRSSLRKNLEFFQWTDDDPGLWWIRITKKWLYQVWFTWSAEFSYGVHAFRVQLYKIPQWQASKKNTIVESRYSGPLGYEPWQPVLNGAWNIRYVSWITSNWDPIYSEYHIDYPLVGEMTEVEWQAWTWFSASLWAVMDRVTTTWNTIVELDVWDVLRVWIKVSSSIRHSWDMLKNIPANFLTWHFALLWADVESWDNWPEAWFSFYANLIHPINQL